MPTRADVAGIIPAQHFDEIFNAAAESSVVLQLGRRLRNMTAKELSLTVQDSMPIAGFVSGDQGLKATSTQKWKDKKIVAEEIAVIIPIADTVLADARDNGNDLWTMLRPQISTAFGKVIDGAVLFSTDKPTSWIDGIVPGALAAGNQKLRTTDAYADVMSKGGLIALVEADGFSVSGFVGSTSSKAYFRDIRSADGIPLFNPMPDPITKKTAYVVDGEPLVIPKNGVMEGTGKPLLIAGDWQELVYSIREDIKFEIFNTGVISDADGKVILNLMQQDTSAIRVTARLGWQLPNPINHINGTEATRYPFAVLDSADPV